MKNIKIFEEFISIITHDPLLEMARININDGYPYDVFVYGGDSYGSGRNEHGDPHFHFSDKIKGGEYQFSILIPTVDEWQQNKELYIYETSTGYYDWRGYNKEKKELINWLDIPNKMISGVLTNIEVIRQQWNILNINNKNVKQLSKIK